MQQTEFRALSELQRKIDYEQKKYKNCLLLCSTADVVGRVKEIYMKQVIYDRLSSEIRDGNISRKEADVFLRVNDLIDKMYLKSKDSAGTGTPINTSEWTYMKNAVRF